MYAVDRRSRTGALALALSLIQMSLVLIAPAAAASKAATAKSLSQSEIRQAEQKLKELGYWTGAVDGVWDATARHALTAFQKVSGAKPTGRLTRAEFNALSVAVPPLPRNQKMGRHVEIDIARQVLFLVDDEGKAANILPISSGSGKRFHENGYPETHAVTPCGRLEVYSKASGWKKSPLGEMHNPLYIVGGIAIHGSQDVPAYPASHGCIRIPMFASQIFPKMVAVGTPVLVYGCREDLPKPAPQVIAAEAPAIR
jgi:lipoprotein-anchoring transpeptidase ErfK/SrfK